MLSPHSHIHNMPPSHTHTTLTGSYLDFLDGFPIQTAHKSEREEKQRINN